MMNESTRSATPTEPNSAKRNWLWFILKLLLSFGLVGVILWFVDFRQVLEIILSLNAWYLFAAAILIYLDRLLMAYKWNQLLQAVDVRVPLFLLFRTYAVAPLSGILLPSTIGGDVFRLYSLSRRRVDTKAVFASMVVERMIGFTAGLLLASLSLALMSYLLRDSLVHVVGASSTLITGGLITAGLIGAMHPMSRRYAGKLVGRFAADSVVEKVHHIYTLCCEYRKHLRTVAAVSTWTLLEQMFPVLSNALMAYSLHIDLSLLELMAIIPVAMLATRLPISLNGLGVEEGIYVVLFGAVGVSASEAFLLSATGRVLPLICLLPWGIHSIFKGG
jgi:uncharacterized protein (TIRG00374 family)